MTIQWLSSDEGQATIERLRGVDPLKARSQVPDLAAEQVTAALTQSRHKPPGYPLKLVSGDGVQQATPVAVALRRAGRLARTTDTVVDAGCGIGLDAWAFQQAGLRVIAFEQDPVTAAIARANGIDVTTADVMTCDLPGVPLYVDPARRRTHADASGRPIRVHDPEQWRPPMAWVLEHASVARVAPGLREIPTDAEWHCSSIGRTLVDATLWFGDLALTARRASVLHANTWHEVVGPPAPPQAGPAQDYIVDPDPAIVRTGLVTNLGGRLIDPNLAFVSFGSTPQPWWGRAMRVLEEVPLKAVGQTCHRLGLHRVTVWARGFDRVPDLGLREGQQGVVVLGRLGPDRVARAWVGHFA